MILLLHGAIIGPPARGWQATLAANASCVTEIASGSSPCVNCDRGVSQVKLMDRAYRARNKDKIRVQQAARYVANNTEINRKRRAHREHNKDRLNAAQKAKYKADPDRFRRTKKLSQDKLRPTHAKQWYEIQMRSIERSWESWCRRIITSATSWDKRNGLETDLDLPYLLTMLEEQNYSCCVAGTPLTRKFNDPNSCSLDRIDNTRGHVKGNVRFTHWWVNRARNNTPAEEFNAMFDRFKRHLLSNPAVCPSP